MLDCRHKLVRCHAHNQTFLVKKFSCRLHLLQDQPSFRCLNILRHNKHDKIFLADQCSRDQTLPEILRHLASQSLLDPVNAFILCGTHDERMFVRLFYQKFLQRLRIPEIRLVDDQKHRRIFLFEKMVPFQFLSEVFLHRFRIRLLELIHLFFFIDPVCCKNNYCHIRLLRRKFCLLHTLCSKLTCIIKSGSINDRTGSERMNLHRLVNRIGRCSGNIRSNRHFLPGKCVDER